MSLPGGDSATPKPTQYHGKKVWGVYVAGHPFHIWTRGEVNQVAAYGVEGVMPIVVPPQDEEWWLVGAHGYPVLEQLVREARAWGLPEGSPICLDVEEGQSSKMSAPADVLHAWSVATSVHKMRNWTYGSKSFLLNDHYGLRWLADWTNPINPQLPPGFQGWQYHGQDQGIDHDIFEGGRDYLSPQFRVVTLGTPKPHDVTAPDARVAHASPAPMAAAAPDPAQGVTTGAAISADAEATGDAQPSTAATPPMTETPSQAGSVSASIESVVKFAIDLHSAIHEFLP